MSTIKTTNGYSKPKQKVSKSQKTDEWAINTAKYYRDACQPAIDQAEALSLYKLANGELDEQDYLYVTNPLGTHRQELMGYPARLMNYDIISPNINLLLGEKTRRQFPPMVIAKNSNYHMKKVQEEQRLLIQELQKRAVNELRKSGIPLDEEKITMELEEIQQRIKNLPDTLAADAQAVLEYIMDLNEVPRHLRKGFYDWLCIAMAFTYKDVYQGKTCYVTVPAIHFKYLCGRDIDFIEDGDAANAQYKMSMNELYDRFQDDPKFDKDLQEFIEKSDRGTSNTDTNNYSYGRTDVMDSTAEMFQRVMGYLPEDEYSDGIEVDHIMWRSLAKEGKLRKTDLFGSTITHYVDEDYIEEEGDDIEWRWVDEIWEAYCAGDQYWFGLRRVPIQRGSFGNPHSAKLLYNGRNVFARHTKPKSLAKKGLPYQKSVNIIKYRAEETLAKNLDKIILFPLGLVPKKEGWDEYKMMYYLRAFNFLFFDDTKNNAAQMVSALKDLDLSSYAHLIESFNLVDLVKREWDEVCGINQQRKGQIAASAGKGVTEQAQAISYTMSEENFLQYEEFENREYTGLVELGKYAFVDGIQEYYVRPDGTKGFLNLHDPDSFIYSDLNVFTKNGAKELQKLELLRNQVQAFAQNQVDPKMISAIIQGDNFAQLDQIMDEIDARLEARRQQELKVQQDVQASKERIASQTLEFNYYSQDLSSYTDIQVALIGEGMQTADKMRQMEANGKSKTDAETYGNLQLMFEKNSIEVMKNATKMREIVSKERIAKHKDETALKNKASGEK